VISQHSTAIVAANEAIVVNGKVDSIEHYFSPEYVVHVNGQTFSGGHDVVRKFINTYHRAFSAIEVDIQFLVKTKNRIAWRRTLSAIHIGAFKGFPATNRPLQWHDMVTSAFSNGLIIQEWVVSDLAENLLLSRK
jgi:predicted ester cyclase